MSNNIGDIISKFLVLVLVTLLVLSFAVWGIGDVFRGKVSNAVAYVDENPISKRDLDLSVSYEARRLQGTFGQTLSQEQIEMLGLKGRVLGTLVNRKLLEIEANNIGIRVSDEQIMKLIRSDRRFSDRTGSFNKDAFQAFLYNAGESETSFISKMRGDILVDILVKTVTSASTIPDSINEILQKYEGEKRQAKIFVIPSNYVKKTRDPDNTELLAYYDEQKEKFAAPEYREISYIKIGISDIADQIDTGEEVLRREYDDRAEEFSLSEKRVLQQMFLSDEKAAKEAYEMLGDKTDFAIVAKEKAGQDEEDTEFGETTGKELSQGGLMPDEVVDSVFSLGVGEYTEPMESSLGLHIFRVTKIIPGKKSNFEDVKEELRQAVLEDNAADILYDLAGQLEDELAGGSTLEDAANNLGLKVNKTSPVGIDGKSLSGNPEDVPEFGNFLLRAFASAEGEDSELVASDDGLNYLILRIDNLVPERIRALDEVRGLVTTAWKEENIKKDLKEFSDQAVLNIKRKISSGDNDALETEASMLLLESKISKPFYRSTIDSGDLTTELIEDLFTLDIGESSDAYLRPDGSYVIGVLSDIIPASEDDPSYGTAAMKKILEREQEQDLITQYILYLKSKYPVEYVGS